MSKPAHNVEGAPAENLRELSDVDLLAVFIPRAVAVRLLEHARLEIIAGYGVSELEAIGGLTRAQAKKLHAAFVAGQRSMRRGTPEAGAPIGSSSQAARYAWEAFGHDRTKEHFAVLLMSSPGVPIAFKTIATGTLSQTIVHPRDVMTAAVRQHAYSMIVFHNHPSGMPEPSPEDIVLTKRLAEAGDVLGIRVLDSIIVTSDPGVFYSFADMGRMRG